MYDLLFNTYYFTVFGVICLLLLLAALVAVVYWRVRKHWQQRLFLLAEELENERSHTLQAHLPLATIHDLPDFFRTIAERSETTLKELDPSQVHIRERQRKIINMAYSQEQRVTNIKHFLKHGQDAAAPMILRIQDVILSVISYHFTFAENKEVKFEPDLIDLEPVLLSHDFTSFAITNVIHNAIKHSDQRGVVRIQLRLREADKSHPSQGKFIWITVEDHGQGLTQEEQSKIFDLGNSLGLYLARELCRLQGGDLILVKSEKNAGAVFRIQLPYVSP